MNLDAESTKGHQKDFHHGPELRILNCTYSAPASKPLYALQILQLHLHLVLQCTSEHEQCQLWCCKKCLLPPEALQWQTYTWAQQPYTYTGPVVPVRTWILALTKRGWYVLLPSKPPSALPWLVLLFLPSISTCAKIARKEWKMLMMSNFPNQPLPLAGTI